MRNHGRLTGIRLHPPQERHYPVLQVHAGYVRVSAIHTALTFTTGSVTCVRDHSYACVGHTDSESAQHFGLGKTNYHKCSYAPDTFGIRTSGLWISSPTLYQRSHPVPQTVSPWKTCPCPARPFRLTGDVAQWLESRNSSPKTLGSIPSRGRVTRAVSCPSEFTLV